MVLTARVLLYGNIFTEWTSVAIPIVYTGLAAMLVRTANRRVALALLCVLLVMYAAFSLL